MHIISPMSARFPSPGRAHRLLTFMFITCTLPSMQLSDYLSAKSIGDADFAAAIGVDRSIVNRIRRGKHTPSLRTMHRIVQATAGAVEYGDLVAPEQAAA